MKKIICLLLVIILANCNLAQAAKNGLIDDIADKIEDKVRDEIEDRFIPFKFKVKDLSESTRTISNEPRRLKFILFYKKKFAARIRNLDESTLIDAIKDNLDIEVDEDDFDRFAETDFDLIDDGLDFVVEDRRKKARNKDFLAAHFISSEFVINSPQKVVFEFNIIDFMEDIGVQEKSVSKTPETSIKFRSVFINSTATTISNNNGSIAIQESSSNNLSSNLINIEFESSEEIDEDIESINFTFARNNKNLKPKAFIRARSKKTVVLIVDNISSEEIKVNKLANNRYSANIAFSMEPLNPRLQKLFTPGKNFKVKIPLKINVKTKSGLKVKVRGIGKARLTVPQAI